MSGVRLEVVARLLNPLCDNLCHANVYSSGDEGENAKSSLLHSL